MNRKRMKERKIQGGRVCECAEYSRVRAWEKGNSRLSGEDSMAASGPSQAKHTAKESSGEEKGVGETGGGEEKELRTLAKTGGGGERRGKKDRRGAVEW